MENEQLKEITMTQVSNRIQLLYKQYPQFFDDEGKFELIKFQDYLIEVGCDVNADGYQLRYLGKEYAKLVSDSPINTVITPDENHNELDRNSNSDNLYFVGDNLEVLKHLRGTYSSGIDVIYIDPPYNTDSERFEYPDKFEFTIENLTKIFGDEEKAKQILNLQGRSSHSAWLTFMYPRILLGYQLLKDTGVMFISIDDNEQKEMKFLLDEIFGEMNFLANNTVIVKTEGRRYGYFAKTHETLYVYAKNAEEVLLREVPKEDTTFEFTDKLGGFDLQGLRNRSTKKFNSKNRENLRYPFYVNTNDVDKDGFMPVSLEEKEGWEEVLPAVIDGIESVWRWGKGEGEKAQIEFHNIIAKRNSRGEVNIYQKKRTATEPMRTLWQDKKYTSFSASRELESYFGSSGYFATPKPLALLTKILEISPDEDNIIVLDYFSGSSTTADAVMRANAKDGKKRKFIMVQMSEPLKTDHIAYENGYRTIDEIGRKRIELAALSIENETNANIDYGYKTYYVHEKPIISIDAIEDFSDDFIIQGTIGISPEDFILKFDYKGNKGINTILSTWLLRDGFELKQKVNIRKYKEYPTYQVGKNLYLINEGLYSDVTLEILKDIDCGILLINKIVIFAPTMNFIEMREIDLAISTRNGLKLERRYE